MFKQSKQEIPIPRRKHTLTPLTKAPVLDDLRLMLTEAQNARGLLIEVHVRREQPPIFVLTCQFDASASDPVWSLYEGEDGSKVLWSYPNGNLEMVFEMICMSIPTASGPLPSSLAPPPAQPQPAAGYAAPPYGAPQQQQPYPQQQQQPYPQQQQQPYPQQQQQPYPQQQQQPYPQQQQPYPPAAPQNYPQPGAQQTYPQQPYPPQPGYPAQGQPYPQQQPGQNWQQPAPGQYPNQQHQAPGPFRSNTTTEQPALKPTDLAGFVDLLTKGQQSNLLLGHLFVEAGVLPEPCLEAALKLQELVRKGDISNPAAVEALRKAAERGGVLDDEMLNQCRAMYPSETVGTPPGQTPKPASTGPMDPREVARQIIGLLIQSGIVTENDVSTAEGVRRKHGGDVGNILVAAGKIEKATLEAARRCQPMVRELRLNPEEAFRIIQHCQKNKSTVEEACRDLSIRPM